MMPKGSDALVSSAETVIGGGSETVLRDEDVIDIGDDFAFALRRSFDSEGNTKEKNDPRQD